MLIVLDFIHPTCTKEPIYFVTTSSLALPCQLPVDFLHAVLAYNLKVCFSINISSWGKKHEQTGFKQIPRLNYVEEDMMANGR